MLELFRDIISHSTHPIFATTKSIKADLANINVELIDLDKPLKPRYVISIFMEFLRTLLENSIP